MNFYFNSALKIYSNFTDIKREITKIKYLIFKNQYPKNFIESKINKILEIHKVNNWIFKQNKNTNTINEKKTEIENWSYLTRSYVGICLIRFKKQNIVIKNQPTSAKKFWLFQQQK